MNSTREKVEALMPVVERVYRGHCWVRTENGPRRIDEPLDDFKIAEHCAGRKAYGACPIAPGTSTCRIAVLDMDSHKGEVQWNYMVDYAEAIAFALQQFDLQPVLWRSSGGQGIHIYLLWDEPQDAYSVRALLREVIESLGYTPGAGGVAKKQIEIFPKQNSVPADGYGSMFILPGSGKSIPL